ncbi:MAG: DUF2877 domain-containing protein [Mycobacterium sp.]
MELVRAQLADETWLPFLTGQYGDAVVDSTYRHAVNVRLASGDMLWVAATGATRAPNALLTDAVGFDSVAAGQPVRVIGAAGMTVGALTVDLQYCRRFSCRVVASDPVDDRVAAGHGIAAEVLARCGIEGGMLHRAETPTDTLTQAMHARLLTGAGALQAAVAAGDAAGAVAASRALIGLGIGSTPSGDDYILGCLAVLLLHCRTRRFGRQLAVGLRPLCADTTPVSRSYLLAACDGRFHVDVTKVIEAIFLGGQSTVRQSVERVIAMGATSGTDTMVGILDTLETLSPLRLTVSTTACGGG